MACPTCGQTMQQEGSPDRFWCPRCGTIVRQAGEIISVPKLVKRCREFEKRLDDAPITGKSWYMTWAELGIAESINLPEKRA